MNPTPLFATPELQAHELPESGLDELQAWLDANPGYSMLINGRPPLPDEARTLFSSRPPPHLPSDRHVVAGVREAGGALAGVVIVDTDLVAPGAWHIALFHLAERLHGRGLAAPLHAALQAWAQAGGARWLRLSVIVGNRRAEAFWARQGYTELRQRHGIDTGARTHSARVMLKPLGPAGIADYLQLVPRDRPDSPLP